MKQEIITPTTNYLACSIQPFKYVYVIDEKAEVQGHSVTFHSKKAQYDDKAVVLLQSPST